jgi:hypothetical protein
MSTFIPPAIHSNTIGSSFTITAAGSGDTAGTNVNFIWDNGPEDEQHGVVGEYEWFQSLPSLPILITCFSTAEALERDQRAVDEGRQTKRRYSSAYGTNWTF